MYRNVNIYDGYVISLHHHRNRIHTYRTTCGFWLFRKYFIYTWGCGPQPIVETFIGELYDKSICRLLPCLTQGVLRSYQIDPYSLYSELLSTRGLWALRALVESSVLHRNTVSFAIQPLSIHRAKPRGEQSIIHCDSWCRDSSQASIHHPNQPCLAR